MLKFIVNTHLAIDKLLQFAIAVLMSPVYLIALIIESIIKKQGIYETMLQAKEELRSECEKITKEELRKE